MTYHIEDITAKHGIDYTGAQSGEVNFPAGSKSASLVISTIPDATATSARTFRFIVSMDGVEVDQAIGTIAGT